MRNHYDAKRNDPRERFFKAVWRSLFPLTLFRRVVRLSHAVKRNPPSKHPSLLPIFLILVAPFLAQVSARAQETNVAETADLNSLSKKYSDTWRQIETKQEQHLTTLKTQYIASLDTLLKSTMANGDLDGVLAAKAEKDRLLTDTPMSDDDRAAMPPELKTARAGYDQAAERIRGEYRKQFESLHTKYLQTLQEQEKKLTMQGRLDDAIAVRAEKDRVMDHVLHDIPPPAAESNAPAGVSTGSLAPAARQGDALKLSTNWKSGVRPGNLIAADLLQLLSTNAEPNVDLAAKPDLVIFDQITYLMPIRKIAELYNQRLSTRNLVNSPAFPSDSFCYYVFVGNYAEGFKTMVVIVDMSDQAVAVQLADEHPSERATLRPEAFLQRWHCYNFVQARTKAVKTWCVGQRVLAQNGIVQIDSEVASVNPELAQGWAAVEGANVVNYGKLRERVRLLLPEPVANIIFARIQSVR